MLVQIIKRLLFFVLFFPLCILSLIQAVILIFLWIFTGKAITEYNPILGIVADKLNIKL